MLDTGTDVSEVVNLVFFMIVRSSRNWTGDLGSAACRPFDRRVGECMRELLHRCPGGGAGRRAGGRGVPALERKCTFVECSWRKGFGSHGLGKACGTGGWGKYTFVPMAVRDVVRRPGGADAARRAPPRCSGGHSGSVVRGDGLLSGSKHHGPG